jgi:hypothetical protein
LEKTIEDLKAELDVTRKRLDECLNVQASSTVITKEVVTKEVQAANDRLAEQVQILRTTVEELLKSKGAPESRTKLATVTEGSFMVINRIKFEPFCRERRSSIRGIIGE